MSIAIATATTIAATEVAVLEITRRVLLLKVARRAHIETIAGTEVTTRAIRECICIIILPHIVVLVIPAIHPLAGSEVHAHVCAIHTIHASVGTAKPAKHAS